jgi:hypothetical protein
MASLIVVLGLIVFSTGCESMGRMTAKIEHGIEKGFEKAEQGISNMENQFEKGKKSAENEN